MKPYTNYVCPVGAGRVGHSSLWTGEHRPELRRDNQGVCICGVELVEEASMRDGYRYRLEWESIDTHQADAMEQAHGTGVWQRLDSAQWDSLSWHRSHRETDSPLDIEAQYERLTSWAETHEQPVRNVRLLRSVAVAAEWEAIQADRSATS